MRGTQEFKTTWVDSGPYISGVSHPVDVDTLKGYWSATNVDTFDYYVCGAGGPTPNSYDDFVRVLDATKGFAVNGRQFKLWLEVAPGSEAAEDGCQVPHDHQLTHFNETALFGPAGYNLGC